MKMVVDKAGRVVIPKQVRDRLGLVPGTELELCMEDRAVVLRPVGPEYVLAWKDGRPVLRATGPVPPLTVDDVRGIREEIYEERERHILNLGSEQECGGAAADR